MLKIHKPNHKLLIISITSILSIGILLGLYGLTYTPELSHADTVTYPEPKPDLSTITYMQDITQEICANTKEADTAGNYQYQLKDKRDEKTYWVAKLRDGNCWMTQNLALDLWIYDNESDTVGHARTLTSEDSDLPEGEEWVSTSGKSVNSWALTSNYRIIKYYNPGEKYCTNNESTACNLSSSSNGGHDAIGNYYTFMASIAGDSTVRNNNGYKESSQSICPKGWNLPLSGDRNNSNKDKNESFYNLLKQYDLIPDTENINSDISINEAPLFFTYASGIDNLGILPPAGTAGYYWSSVSTNTTSAYRLVIGNSKSLSTYSNTYSSYGFSVRCVTPGGERETNNNVEITINNTISLDVVSEVMMEKGDTNPSIGTLPISVASNQPYSVSISSANPSLTSTTSTTTIPSVSGNLTSSTNAWGIKLSSDTNYNQITSTPTTFYTATGAEVKTIPFTIGISTSPDLPNGEYSTEITVTAIQD